MPSFFGYMLWSGLILIPIFALMTVVILPLLAGALAFWGGGGGGGGGGAAACSLRLIYHPALT